MAADKIAQLNIAKELYKEGYDPYLEFPIKYGPKYVGEAVAFDYLDIGYVWEIKPLNNRYVKQADIQLNRYTNGNIEL